MTEPSAPLPVSEPFPSLAALRAAHNELLKSTRDAGAVSAQLDAIRDFIVRGAATGALLDEEDDRETAQNLLDYWSATAYRVGSEAPDATLAEYNSAVEPELHDDQCPYVGLEPFTEQTSQWFFGRSRLIAFLANKIELVRMVALVGPLGSGKSSALRAGLLPALLNGAASNDQGWRALPPITPGADPLTQLAALVRNDDGTLVQRFHDDPNVLFEALQAQDPGATILVVDQLEQLFQLCHDEDQQRAFVNQILAFVEAEASRNALLLALRSDWESVIARFPNLQASFERGARVQLLPLTAPELRDAIEKPAALVGLKFEPGIVDRLIAEMLGEPAALPLLQFTLLKLWDRRERNRITWAAYNDVGYGRLAIARSADATYNALAPDEQRTARRVLLTLARPLRGANAIIRPVALDSLFALGEARERVERVLERLRHERLVRIGDDGSGTPQVAIAHEALAHNWPTLVGWLDAEHAALEVRRSLESRAEEWARLGRGTAGLLDAVQIAEAERWLASAEAKYLGYDDSLAAFVAASRTAIEETQQREIRQVQALADAEGQRAEAQRLRAEEEQHGRRRMTRAFLAIGLLCILALVTASYAVAQANNARREESKAVQLASTSNTQSRELSTAQSLAQANALAADQSAQVARTSEALAIQNQATAQSAASTAVAAFDEATRQQRQAYAGRLAAQSQAFGDSQPQRSLLLAAEAVRTTSLVGEEPPPIALETLRDALTRFSGRTLFRHDAAAVGVAFTDDGRLISAGADQTVRVWNAQQPDAAPQRIDSGIAARALAVSPNGQAVLVVGDTAAVLIAVDAGIVRPLNMSGEITAWAVSRNGNRIALALDNGTTQVWDVAAPETVRSFAPRGRTPIVGAVTLSPDGRLLMTGSADGIARLYDLNKADPVAPVATTTRRPALTAVAMSPNGRWAVIGSADGATHLWSLSGSGFAAGPFVLLGQTRAIHTITISPDSSLTATGSDDGTTYLWQLAGRDLPAPRSVLRGHSRPISGLQISPDNQRLISASADGTAALWNLRAEDPGATQQRLLAHEGPVNAVALSSDGALLATASDDTSVHLWTVTQPNPTLESLPTDVERLVGLVCEVTGRNLTEHEWQTYVPADMAYRTTCGAP